MRFFRGGGGWASRRPPLPDEARELLGLTPGDQVLAWSSLVGAGWAVATPAGLRAVLPAGTRLDRSWTDVDHAVWDRDSGMLAVWWIGRPHPVPLELAGDSFLPEVVHERVRSSVVTSADVAVPGGRFVKVALRKASDGTLLTQALPTPGVRMTDPDVAAAVRRARAQLRDDAGLPPGA